jgi:hypothetical protein
MFGLALLIVVTSVMTDAKVEESANENAAMSYMTWEEADQNDE